MISHSLTQLFPPHAISKVNGFEPVVTPNQYGNCLTQITIFSANPNHCSQYSLWSVLTPIYTIVSRANCTVETKRLECADK